MAAAASALTMAMQALPSARPQRAPSTAPLSTTLPSSLPRSSLLASKLGCSSLPIASSRQLRPSRRGATCVISASYATVVAVTPAARTLFYNVVLTIDPTTTTYTTPGQYVELGLVNSSARRAYFFMASATKAAANHGSMEFLIHDVPDTAAHDLVNSTPGTEVEISKVLDTGFPVKQLYPTSEVETVLLFASGYGLGPIRALIESGFEAHKRPDVRLYSFFGTPDQETYKEKYKEWRTSGVRVIPTAKDIPCDDLNIQDPLKTCAVLCGSQQMQQEKTDCLIKKGVPSEKILTAFPGYPAVEDSKVLRTLGDHPKFLEMGSEYISFHK